MAALLNRARMSTATTGTGTVTLGSAVAGYFTFAEASAVNTTVYSYCIEDGDDFEIGIGTYTSSGTTFSRDTVTGSKISGTAGTTKINLSGTAEIFVTGRVADLGDVFGPASSTASRVARFASTTGKLLEEKPVASFFVHKNGTDQSGIAVDTDTKLTWATEVDDTGGYFDLGNSRWVPPSGTVLFTGKVQYTGGVVDQSAFRARLYKNGSLLATMALVNASGTSNADVSFAFTATANGTDYFELYVNGSGAGTKTVSGLSPATFWGGVLL